MFGDERASAKEISLFLVWLQCRRSAVFETTKLETHVRMYSDPTSDSCKSRNSWISSHTSNFSTTRGSTLRNLLKGNFKGYRKTPTVKQQRQARTANRQSSTANRKPPIVNRKPPTANCKLLTAKRKRPNAKRKPPTANRINRQPRKPPTAQTAHRSNRANRQSRKPSTAQTVNRANCQSRKPPTANRANRQSRKLPTAQTANANRANRQPRKPPTAQTANRANRPPRKLIGSQLIGSQIHNKFERNRPSRF